MSSRKANRRRKRSRQSPQGAVKAAAAADRERLRESGKDRLRKREGSA
jgi:hypothetical protein